MWLFAKRLDVKCSALLNHAITEERNVLLAYDNVRQTLTEHCALQTLHALLEIFGEEVLKMGGDWE